MRFNWHLVHFFALIPVIFSVSLSQKEQEDIRVKCYSSHTIYSHFQGWTTWSHWSQCSSSSGFGIQKRYRNCYSSFACPVGTYQQRICTTAIHGGWSSWTTHSCSKTCGGGYALMQRSCTNPAPIFGGSACRGQYYKYVACNTHPCQVPTTSTTTTPPPTTIWSTKQPANTTKPIPTTATTVVTTPPTTTTTTTTMPPPTTTSTTTTTTTTYTMTTPQTSSTTIRPPLTTTQSTPTTTKKKFFTIRAVIE
eukprot:XP_011437408.1 PREDICTED: cell wall protein DAN4-like isoform X2 [Crassostrea gigas]